jgi:YggT family protein
LLTYQLIGIINIAFRVLVYLIIARCILSFVRHDPYQPIIRFIYDVTEPVMKPFRRIIPSAGGLDFSPFIAVLAVEVIRVLVIQLLMII